MIDIRLRYIEEDGTRIPVNPNLKYKIIKVEHVFEITVKPFLE